MLSLADGMEFRYFNLTSQPLATTTTSNIRQCQMLCLVDERCCTINFRQSINQCELFIDRPGNTGNVYTSVGTLFMIIIDGTRIPPS